MSSILLVLILVLALEFEVGPEWKCGIEATGGLGV